MLTKKRGKLKINVKQLFEANPVWPVIVIEDSTGRVLSLQEVNEAGFRKTLKTGQCWYWDRVNKCIYLKGEHSNEIETLKDVRLDICHARRHVRALHYRVDVAPGACLFGMDRCDFYAFDGKHFSLDDGCVKDEDACKERWQRVNTLLTEREDRQHQKRFIKKKKKG